uniref:Small G protein signaling modulator 1 n=1 Tax=Anthurium amnicola TaxID=1678845 RepID=A0A1D1XPP8_9ARAE
MSFDADERRWICGRAGAVNLHRVSSIVREIREPCLHHSPGKGSKMLRPEKWQSIFDSDGKAIAFRKALRLIVLGGVDPSIRAEVWEFLLGCYALGSTSDYRKRLRIARRERYEDLIRECQMMHSSIGTGRLAYIVGSKVMDVRIPSKNNDIREEAKSNNGYSDSVNKTGTYIDFDNHCTDTSCVQQRESSSDSADLVSFRGSTDSAACDSSYAVNSSSAYNCHSTKSEIEVHEDQYGSGNYFDFPPLPVTNLFQKGDVEKRCEVLDNRLSSEHNLRLEDEAMHSFQISNNVDLVMESTDMPFHSNNSDTGNCDSDVQRKAIGSKDVRFEDDAETRLRISDAPATSGMDASTSNGIPASEDRVSAWLWTLHRIVVDVVRTDNHLEFYEDSKNMARMSDILAVYAWIDPATGYCQGMSDLLSPFVVLYEDNADAFWCFEMLLRRMRENFQMEGPTGVMKQLRALWKILELTDAEIFAHLSLIGAESLHFAFRMLLVLFRRELSFNESLRMWEMMWAADFDEAVARELEENCLGPLVLQFQREPVEEARTEVRENGRKSLKSLQCEHDSGNSASLDNAVRLISRHPFCGLTRASFWSRQDQLQTMTTSTKMGCDELPVFCVAAILIINRQKITRESHSIDDVIKMFNDNMLKINVRRCIHLAIKLRKKYFYKLIKQTSMGNSEQ